MTTKIGKEKIKTKKISFFESGNTLHEEVMRKNKLFFVGYNTKTKKIRYDSYIDNGGIRYVPMDDDLLKKKAVILPTCPVAYCTLRDLVGEIKTFIHKYIDISSEFETLCALMIPASWLYDRFSALSYLRVVGDMGSGKSRFLDVLGRLFYKPSMLTSVTSAVMFRTIEKWKGSLVIDEGDRLDDLDQKDIMEILLTGNEKERFVPRCNMDNFDDVRVYRTYCPKIIASRKPTSNKAYESRCLTEVMKVTSRHLPPILTDGFNKEQMDLRNKLLMFRLINYHKVSDDVKYNIPMGKIEPRIIQITKPLFVVHRNDKEYTNFLNLYVVHRQAEWSDDLANSLESKVVNALYKLYNGKTEAKNMNKLMTPSDISERIESTYHEPISSIAVGKILKELGIRVTPKRRRENVYRVIKYDKGLFSKLYDRYISGLL